MLYLIEFIWREPGDILCNATAIAWLGVNQLILERKLCCLGTYNTNCMRGNKKVNKEHAPSKPKNYEKGCTFLCSIMLFVSLDFNVPCEFHV